MGFLLEAIFELVFQFVVEALTQLGLRALDTRLGRLVAGAIVGFAGGAYWGNVLRDRGHEATPRTLWVSLAFAVGGAVASLALRRAARAGGEAPHRAFPPSPLPWEWSPSQWDAFALLNVFVALGVAVGFGLL